MTVGVVKWLNAVSITENPAHRSPFRVVRADCKQITMMEFINHEHYQNWIICMAWKSIAASKTRDANHN